MRDVDMKIFASPEPATARVGLTDSRTGQDILVPQMQLVLQMGVGKRPHGRITRFKTDSKGKLLLDYDASGQIKGVGRIRERIRVMSINGIPTLPDTNGSTG